MYYLFTALQIASVIGQLGLIVALLRGPARRYLILLTYCITRLVLVLAETMVYRYVGSGNPLYGGLYWTDEAILDLLLFLTVIVLTYKALEGNQLRAPMGKMLAIVIFAAVALPFVLFRRPYFSSHWFTHTSQLLNFGGALMNLVLWTALIASERRDPQLLTVSAGLGVAVTGAAISWGILMLIPHGGPRWAPDISLSITHVTGVFIWWWAFRPAANARRTRPEAVASM